MVAAMFERLRFARYALRFERAYKSDDWGPVRACFHPDAIYAITGSGTALDGEVRGRDEIARHFKRILDDFDRRCDKRIPRITSWPRLRDRELSFDWSARYVRRGDSVVVTGTSRCRFTDGLIRDLRDEMHADECARWSALLARP